MLVVLVSAKGSPGVTTAVVALAATTPAEVRSVVVEADPSGGDLGAAFSLTAEPGLVGLASAARRDHRRGLVWEHAQELPGGLAVVPAPARPEQAAAALDVLLASGDLSALRDDTEGEGERGQPVGQSVGESVGRSGTAGVVWVDAGRLPPRLARGEAVTRLLAQADVVLLVVRNDSAGIVHAVSRLGPVTSAMAGSGRRSAEQQPSGGATFGAGGVQRSAGVLLVGSGGYPAGEVALALGAPVVGVLPWDPRAAAVLAGRPAGRVRNLGRLPLLRATTGISEQLLRERALAGRGQASDDAQFTTEAQIELEEHSDPGAAGRGVGTPRSVPADRTYPFGSGPGVLPPAVSGAGSDGVQALLGRRSR